MRIPFKKINQALKNEFGKGVVKLRPCDWGSYPYILRFKGGNPSQQTMDRATQIVDKIIPTAWQWEDIRGR